MSAATATEWLTAAGLATAAFIPGALLILGLDHDLRRPHVNLHHLLDTDLGARTVVAVFNAKTSIRGTARDMAALVILLTTSPEALR
ncbi:hypothetical protein G3I51_13415 [Streptomyces sp. SID9944]|nr:hypothetical protein [Streptomyces sp. SID9944]